MAKKSSSSSSNSASKIALQLQQLSNEATQKSFVYNREEANTARAWQKEMSDTAHQREVEDLKKAGLNPVLASNQGAQSYTTSSASAQADSATNAVGNVWSSQIGADATRQAAAASAAATRYAASQQAAAARYAASLQYEAQIYGWNKKEKIQNSINKNQLKILDKTPPKNLAEFAWKVGDQTGLRKTVVDSKFVKGLVNSCSALGNNPLKFFKNFGDTAVSVKNFVLNGNGRNYVNNALNKIGVANTAINRNIYVKAVLFSDYHAMRTLMNLVPRKKSNSAQTYSNSGIRLNRVR